MKSKKISVIVPCYNVERFIKKCLESLVNQTYKNLEIICIDDCSTDNTLKILKEYEKKYSNIVIYRNEKNSGLSFTRNAGLEKASGDYIGFIDSDDYVDKSFYKKLMSSIIKNNSEVAVSDIKIVYDDTKEERLSRCYTGNKFNLLSVINNGLAASACNKLFSRRIIEMYKFEVGKVNEDIAVVIPALVNSKKISYASDTYYYYIQRSGSIQNSGFSDKRFDIFDGISTTLERIKKCRKYDDIKDALLYNQIIVLLIYVIPEIDDKTRRRYVLKRFNELSSKYNIRQNHYFWMFLEQCGKKHKMFYKLLFKFVCEGHYKAANDLISLYQKAKEEKRKKSVIKKKCTLKDIENAAKKQQSLKAPDVKVSVIIPNYNYARFMYDRFYSILNQNYKLHEIIFLDDKSSDDSIKMFEEIKSKIEKYVKIKFKYNKENSGSPFKQWERGFDMVSGDYVWIAEADDYCEPTLISRLIKPINRNKNIRISYADTAFINAEGSIILKTIKPEIDIQKTGHWSRSYVNDGQKELLKYSYLNNTIANVSSCIIKNDNYKSTFELAGKFRQAGDWLMYVDIMTKGSIAYINAPINYYRIHGNNVSSTTKYEKHLEELKKIYKYYNDNYKLDDASNEKIKERIAFLKKVWKVK